MIEVTIVLSVTDKANCFAKRQKSVFYKWKANSIALVSFDTKAGP